VAEDLIGGWFVQRDAPPHELVGARIDLGRCDFERQLQRGGAGGIGASAAVRLGMARARVLVPTRYSIQRGEISRIKGNPRISS
jgi:hypothetical protein